MDSKRFDYPLSGGEMERGGRMTKQRWIPVATERGNGLHLAGVMERLLHGCLYLNLIQKVRVKNGNREIYN